jgi:hypothetical protein
MRLAGLVPAISLALLAGLALGQTDPKPPPTGVRREPGLFGGTGGPKKDKKDREADENTRAVAGIVRNEADEPVEGAIVQLKDLKSLKVRSYITKADGVYRFFGLSTNADYELRADLRELSSDKRTLSVFDSRKQAVVNIKLEPRKKDDKEEKDEKVANK